MPVKIGCLGSPALNQIRRFESPPRHCSAFLTATPPHTTTTARRPPPTWSSTTLSAMPLCRTPPLYWPHFHNPMLQHRVSSLPHHHECTFMHCAYWCFMMCLGTMHAGNQKIWMSGNVLGRDATLPARSFVSCAPSASVVLRESFICIRQGAFATYVT